MVSNDLLFSNSSEIKFIHPFSSLYDFDELFIIIFCSQLGVIL